MTRQITKLRALRVNRRTPLTLEELAKITHYSVGHLSEVERGRKGPSDRLLSELAIVYGVPIEKLRKLYREVEKDAHAAA
jgi:transcriptional regulator with XRE-family HTH domain